MEKHPEEDYLDDLLKAMDETVSDSALNKAEASALSVNHLDEKVDPSRAFGRKSADDFLRDFNKELEQTSNNGVFAKNIEKELDEFEKIINDSTKRAKKENNDNIFKTDEGKEIRELLGRTDGTSPIDEDEEESDDVETDIESMDLGSDIDLGSNIDLESDIDLENDLNLEGNLESDSNLESDLDIESNLDLDGDLDLDNDVDTENDLELKEGEKLNLNIDEIQLNDVEEPENEIDTLDLDIEEDEDDSLEADIQESFDDLVSQLGNDGEMEEKEDEEKEDEEKEDEVREDEEKEDVENDETEKLETAETTQTEPEIENITSESKEGEIDLAEKENESIEELLDDSNLDLGLDDLDDLFKDDEDKSSSDEINLEAETSSESSGEPSLEELAEGLSNLETEDTSDSGDDSDESIEEGSDEDNSKGKKKGKKKKDKGDGEKKGGFFAKLVGMLFGPDDEDEEGTAGAGDATAGELSEENAAILAELGMSGAEGAD